MANPKSLIESLSQSPSASVLTKNDIDIGHSKCNDFRSSRISVYIDAIVTLLNIFRSGNAVRSEPESIKQKEHFPCTTGHASQGLHIVNIISYAHRNSRLFFFQSQFYSAKLVGQVQLRRSLPEVQLSDARFSIANLNLKTVFFFFPPSRQKPSILTVKYFDLASADHSGDCLT